MMTVSSVKMLEKYVLNCKVFFLEVVDIKTFYPWRAVTQYQSKIATDCEKWLYCTMIQMLLLIA